MKIENSNIIEYKSKKSRDDSDGGYKKTSSFQYLKDKIDELRSTPQDTFKPALLNAKLAIALNDTSNQNKSFSLSPYQDRNVDIIRGDKNALGLTTDIEI